MKSKRAYDTFMKFYPFQLDDLPGELWKTIPDYDSYQVSNFGRVKSFKGKSPRIMKPDVTRMGYLLIGLHKNNKKKHYSIHRLVAICFIPNPLGKPEINHIDGHPLNCHVSNLEWCTHSENIRHAFDTGLQVAIQGENRHDSKLNNQQVRYIRENPDGLKVRQLAQKFDVDPTTISDIQRGKKYKTAGGVIRDKIDRRIPDDIRAQIRAEYKAGVRGYGSRVLAKKYGIGSTSVLEIINQY